MRTVHKFTLLHDGGDNRIEMDRAGGILMVAEQNYLTTLWVCVDTEAPTAVRTFRVFGTGHPIPEGWVPVGSFIAAAGYFVWHVFECISPPDSEGPQHE